MNRKKSCRTLSKHEQLWRVRFVAWVYFAGLMTLLAPLTPVHTPTVSVANALIAKPEPNEPTVSDLKNYAKQTAKIKYNWGETQFQCLSVLWHKESNWNHLSDNPKSSAFGIAQMLREKSKDPHKQIRNGLKYIQHRYDQPCNAWSFWLRNYYY